MSKKFDKNKEKVADLENKWKRALADYANLEKRFGKEKEIFVKLANLVLLKDLFPLLDDLILAQKHLKDDGLGLVIRKFKETLKNEGLEEILPLGQEFDPALMEAVEKTAGPKNKVTEVVVTGYRMGDRILRPAKVKVGQS